jgi:hypothetical protein
VTAGRPVFSFTPVLEFLNAGGPRLKANGDRPDGAIANVAVRLGVDRRQVYRWLERGLDDDQADVVAITVGVHPALIWVNWFALAPAEAEVSITGPAGQHRPPRAAHLSHMVRRLAAAGKSWEDIAGDVAKKGAVNWRTGRSWSAKDLRSIYGGDVQAPSESVAS